MSELELKFCVPGSVLPSLRQALRQRGARLVRLQAHYFDTADSLLGRNRIALRLRREGSVWVQTLKAPGPGIVHRLEHEVRLRDRGAALPTLDLQRHADTEAGRLLEQLLQSAPGARLERRHGTAISRLLCVVPSGDTLIEVALDSGSASAGDRSVTIDELELELLQGPPQPLFDLAQSWMQHGGLWLSTINKAQRGERLLRPPDAPPATRARPVTLADDADAAQLLRALLQSALEQVLANASELAEAPPQDEVVHQLRVGLRRLRTLLRELAELSPRIDPLWDAALADAFAQLGLQRDQQVVAAAMRPLLEAAHAPQLDWHAPTAIEPAAVVRGSAFQATLLAILALAHADDGSFAALSAAEVRKAVVARVDKLHRQIAAKARRFERLPTPDQHRMRKRVKRLRYLCDFTAALWPQPALRRYLKQLARAQEALGTHNDVAVAAAAFRSDAAEHPQAWFAAGWLQSHLAVTARLSRKALVKVAAARRFWSD